MAKSRPVEGVEVVEERVAPAEAPPSAPASAEVEYPMSFEQYCERHRGDLHRYTRAYLGEKVRGTLRTRAEWDLEVPKLVGGKA